MKAWPDARSAALGARLAERARRSVQAHRDYRTMRHEDLVWAHTAAGAQEAVLNAGEQARTTLVRLQPGAVLPWPAQTQAQEILVVQGGMLAQPLGLDTLAMQRHGFALRDSAAAGTLTAADGAPAMLYVRNMLLPPQALPGPEGRWWALPRLPLQLVPAVGRRWRATFTGVEVLPLWGTAEITSMLVRFAPGAGVPDHHHAANEDCLMLEGEMFLGDILLRPGDYQLAPAGGGHFGETSDVGGTFFFHGAIDPVLVPPKLT